MNRTHARLAILDQQADLKTYLAKNTTVERDIGYSITTNIFKRGHGTVIIQGVRRCGKSTYAMQCFNKQGEKFAYVNFDDERLLEVKAEDLNSILEIIYKLYGHDIKNFIFDEIQNILGWELFVSRLQKNANIIVTGSNSKLLSSELGTHLTGRYHLITLYPFSFKEHLRFKRTQFQDYDKLTTKEIGIIKKELDLYMLYGGFPDIHIYGHSYPQTIYSDILTKDIVIRHKIKDVLKFRTFAKYLISVHGNEYSISKIANFLEVKDPQTLSLHLSYLEESYLVKSLPRYFHKLKAQITSNKKIYCIDNGIIRNIAFTPTESFGSFFENLIYLELLRKKEQNNIYDELFHINSEGYGVDFVLHKRSKLDCAIQACYDLSNLLTKEREISALQKVHKEYGVKELVLINSDVESVEKHGNIKVQLVPLWKWLTAT